MLIPVREGHDEYVAWHFDSKGIFSVKSACRVLCDDNYRSSRTAPGESSSGAGGNREKIWSMIWNMEGPNRLKYFMWRLAHNSLVLRSNLSGRGMKIDPRCLLCNYAWEDGGHVFLRCKHVKVVWRCAGLVEDLRV